jgi:hypothetical protein
MMKFNVGAKMCFDATRHEMQVGILIKFNQRTVTVPIYEGRHWKWLTADVVLAFNQRGEVVFELIFR